MLHAIGTPSVRWILLSAALLGAGALAHVTAPNPTVHRLRLHAEQKPGEFYLSVFHDGDVTYEFPTEDIVALEGRVTAEITDGCRWMGIETLTPLDDKTFLYSYDEKIISCDADAKPTNKTPRTGIVTVED